MRFWSSKTRSGTGQKAVSADNVLYLSDAIEGKSYTMLGLEGGHSFREKIYSMGLNKGVAFKIILNSGRGPVELEVRQARLAIGRGMTRKIKVRTNDTS